MLLAPTRVSSVSTEYLMIPGPQWTTAFGSMIERAGPQYEPPSVSIDIRTAVAITSRVKCRVDEDPLNYYDEEQEVSVRGLAPETWVGLSRYSVTIKLREDSGWRPLYILSLLVCYEPPSDVIILVICVTSDAAPALSPESTFFIEYCAGGPSSATPVLLSCVASFDTAPPPQDLLAGLLYTAPPPSTGDGSFDSCLSSP
ncbi:uncharacterized protein UHOD_11189 [Ustilago sp. UG-2017b]|nr:uncharacterized protein UHOD_11189 [Ustilago sp. UG-2017b]